MLIFFIFSCNSADPKKEFPKLNTVKSTLLTDTPNITKNSLIDSLYKNVSIIKGNIVDSFSCEYDYISSKKLIRFICSSFEYNNKMSYELNLLDTTGIYTQGEPFTPTTDYKYLTSFIELNGKKKDLKNLHYFGQKEIVDPIVLWYGKGFGSAAKYYQLADRKLYLIRGLNYYCNGTNCTNYKVFVIQKFTSDNSFTVTAHDFPGKYPYRFENIELFKCKGDEGPCIYSIKQGKTGSLLSDYILLNLNLIRQ